jgi:hypothetical protein
MNSFFPASLPYAETHYKFKLPWSPLYRRWPEIFIDGPSFAVPGVIPQFYLVIKDADFFPITIKTVDLSLGGSSSRPKQSLQLDLRVRGNLEFIPLAIDFSGCMGEIAINAKVVAEKPAGQSKTFLNHNFPGLFPAALEVRFLESPLPYPGDWHAGEMHCHSDYSNDPVEYGAPLSALQAAGKSLGMGFVLCTDHSYDFYYDKTRYMEATDPIANFQAYRQEALRLNTSADPQSPLLIPGEEVSCGNGRGENVHLLVAGHEGFLPGLGDGGRRWFNNKPDLTVAEVLDRLGDTPCFAAHPRARVGTLERLIFRRGMWDDGDLRGNDGKSIHGLQFWNGHTGLDFREGRAFWVKQLLAGKRLFPIGANDAHGDLNQNIGVKTPLFSLYQARNHVFGRVRTVVQSGVKSIAGIQAGLAAGRICATDGPFLRLVRVNNGIEVSAATTSDFGALRKVVVFSGTVGDSREAVVKDWNWTSEGPQTFTETIPLSPGRAYFRAEARTVQDRLAIASPVFLG